MQRTHLVDHLATAKKNAPHLNHIEVQSVAVGKTITTAIFHHPDSVVRFPPMHAKGDVKLTTACGIKTTAWEKIQGAVRFRLAVRSSTNEEHDIAELIIAPRQRPEHRAWIPMEVTITEEDRFGDEDIRLVLETSMADPDIPPSHAWAAWSDPQFTSDYIAKPPRIRKKPKPLFLVLTADALRRDHLGCYKTGTGKSTTPNIDKLAEESLIFEETRTNATTTPGSYTTMFTGMSSLAHGIHAEWGQFPTNLMSLPLSLAEHGFKTVIAASESELTSPEQGFSRVYQDNIPCISNPAQDGHVTSRNFLRWLDGHDIKKQPAFGWVQFFDTHPPECPPQDLLRKHYPHDPTSPEREMKPEIVAEVRGIESVLDISWGRKMLERGIIPRSLLLRLETTADFLLHKTQDCPDLAAHLTNLDESARCGLPHREFGKLLAKWARQLRKNEVNNDLLRWLEELEPVLRELEADILCWLDDVKDVRYIDALYDASVSSFDRIIGSLRSALEARGLWESTTIILSSPHGEILTEELPPMHHHSPTETVTRVPLLIKPGILLGELKPRRISGTFDLQDLYPTLLGLCGQNIPPCDGEDLSDAIRTNTCQLPYRPSLCTDFSLSSAALTMGTQKLFKCFGAHSSRPTIDGPFPLIQVSDTQTGEAITDQAVHARLQKLMDDQFSAERPVHGARPARFWRKRRADQLLSRS